jgi:hypothetical protein
VIRTGAAPKPHCKHIYGAMEFIRLGGLADPASDLATQAQGRAEVVAMPARVAPDEGTISTEQADELWKTAEDAFGAFRATSWLKTWLAKHGVDGLARLTPALASSLPRAIEAARPIPTAEAKALKDRLDAVPDREGAKAELRRLGIAAIREINREQTDELKMWLKAQERQKAHA